MKRSGEFEWINRYLAPLAGEGSFDLRDDAAILTPPDEHDLVVTQDAILEEIHFLPDDPVDLVARKALRVNISDIVAKGGRPFAYSLALGVPDDWSDPDMKRFCVGLRTDQQTYGIELTGGDTYRSPDRLCVAITMFGAVARDHYVSRLGAKAGDLLVVSGTIGDAAIGLKVATGEVPVAAHEVAVHIDAYRLPDPPLALAKPISEFASASMDVSDGLLGDCRILCSASNLAATIDRSRVPLSASVRKVLNTDVELWPTILAGGDDYQCLCTVSPGNWNVFRSAATAVGLTLTEIGKITEDEPGSVSLMDSGVPLSMVIESFTHF